MSEGPPTAVTERFDRAEAAIDREHRRTSAELDALEAFIDEVGTVSPASTDTATGPTSVRLQSSRTSGLEAVREAFESTMMAVPHYEEAYGESYAEHLRHELGPDVATLLTSGQLFERHTKQAVVAAAHDARTRRGRLLDELERERDSLDNLIEPVCAIATDTARLDSAVGPDRSRKILDGYQARVGVLERRCHELIDQRQSTLVSQRRSMSLSLDGPDIATCVYSDLDVDYPAVATLTDLLARLGDIAADLDRRLSKPA